MREFDTLFDLLGAFARFSSLQSCLNLRMVSSNGFSEFESSADYMELR